MHTSLPKPSTKAFSLVEVLIVISIIGVLTAISIPHFAGVSDEAKITTAKLNAKNFSRISTSLSQVDVEHVIPQSLGGVEATCRLIRHGITVPDGAMAGEYFGMPGIDEEEIPPAAVYLSVSLLGFSTLVLICDFEATPNVVDPNAVDVNVGGKKKKKK